MPNQNAYNPGNAFTKSSGYGNRILNGKPDFHPGVDFAAVIGTPIPAASSGVVVYSGFNGTENKPSYGNVVIIKSIGSDGVPYYTLYAHQNGFGMPAVGDAVNKGDIIGQVGNTGKSFGAHLHFEVLNDNASVNNASGGPVGFTSKDTSIRSDPSAFESWGDSGKPYGAGNSVPPGLGGKGGPEDAVDPLSGDLISESEVVTATNSVITQNVGDNSLHVFVSGQGGIVNQSDASITLAAGASATLVGDNNVISAGIGSTLTLMGSNTIETGLGALTVSGESQVSQNNTGNMITVNQARNQDGTFNIEEKIFIDSKQLTRQINGESVTFQLAQEDNGDWQATQILSINGAPPVNVALINAALKDAHYNPLDIGESGGGGDGGSDTGDEGTIATLVNAGDSSNASGYTPVGAGGANQNNGWWNSPGTQRLSQSLTGVQGLLAAVHSGNNLGIATSFFDLVNRLDTANLQLRPDQPALNNGQDPGIGNISAGLNTVSDYLSLRRALQHGDAIEVLRSASGVGRDGLALYQQVLNSQGNSGSVLLVCNTYH